MSSDHQPLNHGFVLYKRRWFMLAVVVMFNVSNAMIWISFAPVANYAASYFTISETLVNWFSLVFFVAFVPFCGVSWWAIETLGFKFSVILGSLINAIGAVIRIIGVVAVTDPNQKYYVVMIGQVLAACTQPLVLSMPTKLAAMWFGDHERTLANTIASMSNPLGVALANALAPVIVSQAKDLEIMIIIFGIPAVIGALMAMFGFWSSKPPSPPSASAQNEPVSFFVGMKEALKNRSFVLLAFASGCGIGAFSAITTILQQLICVKGYNNTIAGVTGAMVILGGFIGAAFSSLYVDKTKNYINVAKIMGLLLALASAFIIIFVNLRHQAVPIVLSFTLFGFFGLGVLPVFLELGVECTYPVDEATTSGIQWMIGQALGAIMMAGGQAAAPKLTKDQIAHSACDVDNADSDPLDLSYPLMVMALLCTCFVLFFIMFFDTKYKRLEAEQRLLGGDIPQEYDNKIYGSIENSNLVT